MSKKKNPPKMEDKKRILLSGAENAVLHGKSGPVTRPRKISVKKPSRDVF
jgi:hypothetical protein